jgi:hypothetical protein
MQCPRCQHENPDNARFCGDCGAALEARACGACGAPVASGQKFCRFCGTPLDSLSASTRRPLPTSHDGERRQITVMFCDLVGSTALSAAMDPEDLRDVIGVYHACAAEIVARYEGFVAQYLGDGVLVYFGYPQAHEDDAERAVRAGLALVEAVGRLGVASERLQVRIGIATGLVIVGELIGSGEAKEPRGYRRDAEPGGPASANGQAQRRRDRIEHAPAPRRPLRLSGSRHDRGQGLR